MIAKGRLADVAWVLGTIAGALAVWEAGVKIFDVPAFVVPSLEAVAAELVSTPGFYLHNLLYTLSTTLMGFGLAVLLGVAMAVLIVSSRFLDRVLYTLLALIHNVPKVALAPLFVLWLGTGVAPKIAISAMISIFTIVVDVVIGMRSVDPEMVNMALVKRAGRSQILWRIRFPHALPHFFASLKAAISFALVGAIVGEFVGGQDGLGTVILVAEGSFETVQVFAAVILLGLLGTMLFYAVVAIESLALPWHVSQRTNALG